MPDEERFMVCTKEGNTTATNAGEGFATFDEAQADADRRNKRAEKLGVKARYEVRGFGAGDE